MLKHRKAGIILLLLIACVIYAQCLKTDTAYVLEASMPVPEQEGSQAGNYQAVFHCVKLAARDVEQAAIETAAFRRAEQAAAEQAIREEAARSAQLFLENQKLLAAIIFCEAGNQPYEGQVAVGAVVMNRVNSGIYPNNIYDVLYDKGQFGPAATGWLNQVLANESYTESSWQAAADALNGSNPVGSCLYFDKGNNGLQIGEHYFH